MKMLKFFLTAIVLVTASSPNAFARSVTVSQKERKFVPDSVELSVGDTLIVRNDDMFLHQIYVKSPNYNYNSSGQPSGAVTELPPFEHAGDYEVLCEIHPKMHLTVHVR